ncbi:MAG TPA: trypsin-like peptidase domain-containing protein [Acidimicrobiales bacterium]|jgi:S1-C subfamily serine protease|nr:trypsin-like peptidase domain-containing protein [Acidimicrobiales bacterium]
MEFEDGLDDDPSSYRTPPPPDDRLWRHPSELLSKQSAGERTWLVASISGMVGALLATAVVVVAGGVGQRGSERVIERQEMPVQTVSTGATGGQSVVDIAQRVRSAITQIRVQGKDGDVSGSGVLFRSDGHLLTNFHVIDGADAVKVVIDSGRELTASVIGSDPDNDVAVLKIDGGPFPVATLGSAADLRVGQPAIAIGSPLGLAGGPSVTVGVVSALHRRLDTRAGPPLLDMIQTDAPISPGSSGGALLDANGAVIGLTTAVATSDGAQGLGFATPIDVARSSADQLIAGGKVVHVWLGIEGTDVDPTTAKDMSIDGGALVGRVVKDSPADKGGLQVRDVIVAVDNQSVKTMGALVVALRGRNPGSTVSLDVRRGKDQKRMTVSLVERPPNP